MDQSGKLVIIGENDSDTENPVDSQSLTQTTPADQEGSIDDTASTDRHVETPCKSQTHQPKVEKYEDSLLQTEEKVSERRDIIWMFVTLYRRVQSDAGENCTLYAIRSKVK